ncbi:Uncharacterized conserved protein, DUF427 family [Tistlia consotensis]|uniref:Uncharacterized conserved protein, DUF427 family n=1 Tax=Tistlia consotensis USBA 355 TaxID=560819 RepID=A0A1Y6B9Q8_9PROT|nr:DUF427 domain-containing protein [Tistlia consotensis]SMF00310.1 Uncharacterized conserved protein, DUF427 family [Tistlia consotensis USBA 355]SNR75986.1 Uncharacterized conserved protein, DUF427 family [Tistlia consotensis]
MEDEARVEDKGSGHRIEIEPSPDRVIVTFAGETVADSKRALLLHETGHKPVAYLPIEDVRQGVLQPSDRTTHCPFKGDAAYFHLKAGGRIAEDAVWTYPTPYGSVAEIENRVAFYVGRIDGLEQRFEKA